MKLRALLLASLFVVGISASFAFAKEPKPPKPAKNETSTTTTTTVASAAAPTKPKCEQVELKGKATAGSVTFTVTKASKRGTALVGTSVALTVPADAKIKAKACTTGGVLTLRDLHVKVGHPKP